MGKAPDSGPADLPSSDHLPLPGCESAPDVTHGPRRLDGPREFGEATPARPQRRDLPRRSRRSTRASTRGARPCCAVTWTGSAGAERAGPYDQVLDDEAGGQQRLRPDTTLLTNKSPRGRFDTYPRTWPATSSDAPSVNCTGSPSSPALSSSRVPCCTAACSTARRTCSRYATC